MLYLSHIHLFSHLGYKCV